jgi:iron complex outermembrane receptor protein
VNFLLDNQAEAKWAIGTVTGSTLFGLDLAVFEDDEVVKLGFANSIDVFRPVYGQMPIVTDLATNDSDALQTQLGLYVQNQAKLFERWVWVLGGRFDWADNDVRDRIRSQDVVQRSREPTWRIGTVYLLDGGVAPYGTYATSFDPVPGTDVFGEVYQPTTGELGEVGVKYEPPGFGAFVTASLFTITQDNVLTTDPDNPLNQIQLGQVRSRGAEVEGVATLADGLSLLASYSYTDIETTESTNPEEVGKRPVVVPSQLASGWIDYTQPWGMLAGLGGGVGVRYVGSSFGNLQNTFEVPGYTLVDAAIRWERGPWRVTLNVSNLANETFASCSTDVACFYGGERNLIGAVRYRF